MASGRAHDRATLALSLPLALLVWPLLGPRAALAAAAGFLLGGLWLSPDLDTHSRSTHRWGPLACLWWPYRRLRHRSLVSHSPLLGSAGRLAYLALLALGGLWLLQPLGLPGPERLGGLAAALWQQQRQPVLAALAGVEASSWLHLLQDGDPLPRWPRPLRRWCRRRRRRVTR
ncbi:MAG: DUF2227 family putative metal-binding protein [Prochlorococcaceae cyanobacterium]